MDSFIHPLSNSGQSGAMLGVRGIKQLRVFLVPPGKYAIPSQALRHPAFNLQLSNYITGKRGFVKC